MKKPERKISVKKPVTIAKNLRAAANITGLPMLAIQRAKQAGCKAFHANGNIDCDQVVDFVSAMKPVSSDALDYYTEKALSLRADRLLKEQRLAERQKLFAPIADVKRAWTRNTVAAKTKFYESEGTITAEAAMKLSLAPDAQATLREIIHRHHRRALVELFQGELGKVECPNCNTEIKTHEENKNQSADK